MFLHVVTSDPGVIAQFSTKLDDGSQLHSFLSNGYVEPDGSFVEREYQAAKAARPADAKAIMACEKPFGTGGAKNMGHEVIRRTDWLEVRYQVMTRLVLQKFFDHPSLAHELLATGDKLLIEGNTWHDNIWGDCTCANPHWPGCLQQGRNLLGQILMSTRELLHQLSNIQ